MKDKPPFGVFWSAEGSSTAEGSGLQPGEVAFGHHEGEWLVRIRPDGTLVFGKGYSPDAAAEVFWKALAAHHPNVSLRDKSAGNEQAAYTQAMESLLVAIGRADLHNEAMQYAASREEATEHDRFQAQLAISNLEIVVHRVIEFGRGLAIRIRSSVVC